ncbi:hypothetical protein WJX72_011226 [[Myrmecia] bisecta]|uniref:Uncharacterized protein n=1 Tax=[Myrmecia] bisecta TaxID=41462 RepID=A0AAW1R973_9CHLO
MDSAPVNEYELQRLQRIERNQRVMQALGLTKNSLCPATISHCIAAQQAAKRRRRFEKAFRPASEPLRASRRIAGKKPEEVGLNNLIKLERLCEDGEGRTVQILRSPCNKKARMRSSQSLSTDLASLHNHNMFRLRTMSKRALSQRIHRIRRVDKLQSFIEVRP